MWVLYALCSAFFLGIYDVFKKRSLNGNAVLPVLFLSVCISSLIFVPVLVWSGISPASAVAAGIYVPAVDAQTHLYIFLKSVLVLSSWACGFFALKHLPVTIFAPIRATQPVWTIVGALLIFGEQLAVMQVVGIAITLVSFFLFSTAGHREGIYWKNNVWVWLIIAATLLGACSGLYDKHLLRNYDRMAVQVYSTLYQAAFMFAVLMLLWWPTHKKTTPFQWRWSIVGISVFLVVADYVYYFALSQPDSLISVVSTIRRSGAVISFLYGAFFLKEKNLRTKFVYLLGVLLGVTLLVVK